MFLSHVLVHSVDEQESLQMLLPGTHSFIRIMADLQSVAMVSQTRVCD